jgi:hypothetical protein
MASAPVSSQVLIETLDSTISDMENLLVHLQGSKPSPAPEAGVDLDALDGVGEPYESFADFKEAIMAHLFIKIGRKIEQQYENPIRPRGITVKAAFMAFLGIRELSSEADWQVPFEKNSKVLGHLEAVYAKEKEKLTPFSLEVYAGVIADDLWSSLVIRGSETVEASEQVIADSQVNRTSRVMSEDLAKAVSKPKPPGRLLKAIDAYQERMIEEQPEGFNTFLAKHWLLIVGHIGNMQRDRTTHAARSKSVRKQYLRDAYVLLADLVGSHQYFTYGEFLNKEVISIDANPDNGTPLSSADGENKRSGNISSSTGGVFKPGYKNDPAEASKLIKQFNSLNVPFVSAKPVPEELWGDADWLQKNVLSQVRPIDDAYLAVLTQIAQYLKSDDQSVILITGRSDYGDLQGTGDHARAVALARARYMKARLVEMGVRASQIETEGLYDTVSQIGIEISLKR